MMGTQRDKATRDRWRQEMWQDQRGLCHWCRKPMSRSVPDNHPDFPTFEHLIPTASGGTSRRSNLALAHRGCNNNRGAPVVVRSAGYDGMPTALYEAFKRAGLVSA